MECNCCINKKTPVIEVQIGLEQGFCLSILSNPILICLDCEQKLKTKMIDQETKTFYSSCLESVLNFIDEEDSARVDFEFVEDFPDIHEILEEIKKI